MTVDNVRMRSKASPIGQLQIGFSFPLPEICHTFFGDFGEIKEPETTFKFQSSGCGQVRSYFFIYGYRKLSFENKYDNVV